MTKHPLKVEKYNGTLEELAEDIMNLRYDKTAEFIKYLSDKTKKDGDADSKRPSLYNSKKKRKKLASKLYKIAKYFHKAEREMNLAWKISKPYMKD